MEFIIVFSLFLLIRFVSNVRLLLLEFIKICKNFWVENVVSWIFVVIKFLVNGVRLIILFFFESCGLKWEKGWYLV